jgi:hypothetical protein
VNDTLEENRFGGRPLEGAVLKGKFNRILKENLGFRLVNEPSVFAAGVTPDRLIDIESRLPDIGT